MSSKIDLDVKQGNVVANEVGAYKGQGGNFHERAGQSVVWRDKATGHGFVVDFYDVSKCLTPDARGWPFSSPNGGANQELEVSGTDQTTVLRTDLDGTFWKYTVRAVVEPGSSPAKTLDPMIIVRETKTSLLGIETLLTFGLGLLAGALIAWLRMRSRPVR